jgi:hypothetical protein
MPLNFFKETDEKLQEIMLGSTAANTDYKACFDILLLRSHERLIAKTEELVNETNALVRKTWWVAIATWVVAGATILTILTHP